MKGGGGVIIPVYKKLYCKFCTVLDACLQHKWTKKYLLRSQLSKNCQKFMPNMDIFLTDVRIFWSNFVVTEVYDLFFQKNLENNIIKRKGEGGWGGQWPLIKFIEEKKI